MAKIPPKALEEQLLAFEACLREHGYWRRGRLGVPFTAVALAVWPDVFRDPPEPDLATELPGGTPERLQQLIDRAEANRALFPPNNHDLDLFERLLAARMKRGKKTRKDRRKHYEVVVEGHQGPKKVS